jgi:hypothetical protein
VRVYLLPSIKRFLAGIAPGVVLILLSILVILLGGHGAPEPVVGVTALFALVWIVVPVPCFCVGAYIALKDRWSSRLVARATLGMNLLALIRVA